MADSFDLIVLGSGPGGYVAAIRAAQLGMKVAIIELERLGGVCLNWGCIPTKTLLRSAEMLHLVNSAEAFGLMPQPGGFDLARIVERSRSVADQLNAGVGMLMRKHKIAVYEGSGKLAGPGSLEVTLASGPVTLIAQHIIIATGARPRDLPFAPTDGNRIWNYRTAMTPPVLPSNLLVVGSGAIGLEFASFYSDLGVKVAIVEMQDQVLPNEDREVSRLMVRELAKRGIECRQATSVTGIEYTSEGLVASFKDAKGEETSGLFSHAVIAIGVRGNCEGIGLETVGIASTDGFLNVDGFGRTSESGIYAIGDIAGPPCLAHKAMHQGVICAEAIAGLQPEPLNSANIPNCTYSRPQVASIGLTEAQAAQQGRAVVVGRFPFLANGKAIAIGEASGFVKTILDRETGQLIGAHLIGPDVTELIAGLSLGQTAGLTQTQLTETIFPHPTLTESIHESVLAALGKALHI